MAGPYAAAGSNRNFGYGRDLGHAGYSALKEYYGGGHFSTVATHASRWDQFTAWAKEQGVRDLARNNPQQLLEAYAAHVGSVGSYSAAYAQNLISTAQVTMRALTADLTIRVHPSDYTKGRENVRTVAPDGMDRDTVIAAAESLRLDGLFRAAAVIELARSMGLRVSEAALAPLDRWAKEADARGFVQVTEGAKGGRDAERLIRITPEARTAIEHALAARPEGSRNLVAEGETKRQFVDGELALGRSHLESAGLSTYHDLRAAYACERYQAITGHAAPAVAGERTAGREIDRAARAQIGYELGHGRTDVCVAYLGSAR